MEHKQFSTTNDAQHWWISVLPHAAKPVFYWSLTSSYGSVKLTALTNSILLPKLFWFLSEVKLQYRCHMRFRTVNGYWLMRNSCVLEVRLNQMFIFVICSQIDPFKYHMACQFYLSFQERNTLPMRATNYGFTLWETSCMHNKVQTFHDSMSERTDFSSLASL